MENLFEKLGEILKPESKLDELIKLSEKKTSLLKELKESQIYEKCYYHLVLMDTKPDVYGLYRINDKKQLVCGNIIRIKSYINLQGIDTALIYDNKYLTI